MHQLHLYKNRESSPPSSANDVVNFNKDVVEVSELYVITSLDTIVSEKFAHDLEYKRLVLLGLGRPNPTHLVTDVAGKCERYDRVSVRVCEPVEHA